MLDQLASPQNIQSLVVFLLAFLARDVVVALVRAASAKLLSDKDKSNDDLGRVLALIADNLAKTPPAKEPKA